VRFAPVVETLASAGFSHFVEAGPRPVLAAAIQERAFEVVPYLPTGQWKPVTAYHKNVKGIIQAPPYLMWNVEKA